MKFYLASKFAYLDKVIEVMKELESLGHTITCKWWTYIDIKNIECADYVWWSLPIVKSYCDRDLRGIRECDALICIGKDNPSSFNGASVEIGYAMALGRPCFILGNFDRCAMYAYVRHVDTIKDVLIMLEKGWGTL